MFITVYRLRFSLIRRINTVVRKCKKCVRRGERVTPSVFLNFKRCIMKNTIAIFLILIGILSCKTKEITVKDGRVVSFNRVPPNGIFINDTLICDETELANTDYREYLYWVSRVFGYDSQTYQDALPDTMASYNYILKNIDNKDVLKKLYTYDSGEIYFHHPSYNDYPVIGLTYEQAANYSNWRTNIVFQMMLINSNLIEVHIHPDSTNYFTVEKYAAGHYFNYKPPKGLYVARFRLPTVEEWELCTKQKNSDDWGVDSTNQLAKKFKKSGWTLFKTKEDLLTALKNEEEQKSERRFLIPFTAPVRSLIPNRLFNMVGNVAEMTSIKGIAKGGSWAHPLEECKIKNTIRYDKPEAWLGFRNVCTWEKL